MLSLTKHTSLFDMTAVCPTLGSLLLFSALRVNLKGQEWQFLSPGVRTS